MGVVYWWKGGKETSWPWSFDVINPARQDWFTSHRLRSAAGSMEMAALCFWRHVGSIDNLEWISKPMPNCWTGTGREWPLISVLPSLCSSVPKVGWDGKGRDGEKRIWTTVPHTSLLLSFQFPPSQWQSFDKYITSSKVAPGFFVSQRHLHKESLLTKLEWDLLLPVFLSLFLSMLLSFFPSFAQSSVLLLSFPFC